MDRKFSFSPSDYNMITDTSLWSRWFLQETLWSN